MVNEVLSKMEGLIPKLLSAAPLAWARVAGLAFILGLIAYYIFVLQNTELASAIIVSALTFAIGQVLSVLNRKKCARERLSSVMASY
ncbi:hypothetical protein E6H33_06060 [Candidatus Bathyarchaeota archaeon]|nr:MAG: hypothetical protein E6H33_06060 [Candidatus Bathyarchaeota archaeon]